MPLFYTTKEDNYQMVIWEIKESESFFRQEIGGDCLIKFARRRLEFFTGRFLLKMLSPTLPIEDILINKHGKPFVKDPNLHFSISHSFPYVGVILSKYPIGIDVQTYREKIVRIRHKFLSPYEQALFGEDIRQITLAWAAKEAAFKWSEFDGFDLINHLPIQAYNIQENNAEVILEVRRTEQTRVLRLSGKMENHFGWMITHPLLREMKLI